MINEWPCKTSARTDKWETPSPTSPTEALIITCHLSNILMPAPDSLHFYGNLNHAQVWNTPNNEDENHRDFD